MIISFLESIKYVGYTFPLSFFRIYLGYLFFKKAMSKTHDGYLSYLDMMTNISERVFMDPDPNWYEKFLTQVVISEANWKLFAYITTYCEFMIGLSFLIGFLVRPISVLGMLLSLHYIWAQGPFGSEIYQLFFALFVVTLWMGAGRSLGLDYFFYKRHRGWLW